MTDAATKKTFVVVTGDDRWEALYVNGQRVTEGHEITLNDLAHHAGLDFDYREADSEWLVERGGYPDRLKNVKVLD